MVPLVLGIVWWRHKLPLKRRHSPSRSARGAKSPAPGDDSSQSADESATSTSGTCVLGGAVECVGRCGGVSAVGFRRRQALDGSCGAPWGSLVRVWDSIRHPEVALSSVVVRVVRVAVNANRGGAARHRHA